MAIQLLRTRRARSNLPLVHLFSSDSGGDQNDRPRSAITSLLGDVKSSLRSQPQPSPAQRLLRRTSTSEPPPPPEPPSPARNVSSFDEIRKSLSLLNTRSAAAAATATPSFRDSLRRPGGLRAPSLSVDIGRSPKAAPKTTAGGAEESATAVARKLYGDEELGERLRALRPGNAKGGDWFSWEELSGRLAKIRESDEAKQKESNSMPDWHYVFKDNLNLIRTADEMKAEISNTIDIIQKADVTPSYMTLPPKDHLLEKYYHPDNMSAAEKMKLELARVRDEFKISESDCGSTRVQVALLTTKIKYLTSVLHKKDKHSRKGLVEMTNKRKKLLKYLRRTDWESYCYVLDKLGLRDVRNFKQ